MKEAVCEREEDCDEVILIDEEIMHCEGKRRLLVFEIPEIDEREMN